MYKKYIKAENTKLLEVAITLIVVGAGSLVCGNVHGNLHSNRN